MIVEEHAFPGNRTEPELASWAEVVVPAEVELLPHSRYAPQYAWMFAYEKRLKYRIEELLGRHLASSTDQLLFGPDGVLSEALSNAFVHGHRRNPRWPIEFCYSVTAHHLFCSICDQGPGFDVSAVLVTASRGGTYYRYAGNGLRVLGRSDRVVAAFSAGGRRILLRIRLDE